ncbi:MAG: SPOR domain-containing protein [Acidobacteria bacterium]|nr:SPOR domain-containing protein [Acidobacteriota bacterium]
MTKHTMITFRLHRSGLILLVICALIVAALLFAAGWMGGMQYTSSRPAPVVAAAAATPPPPPPVAATTGVPIETPSDPFALRLGAFTAEDDAKAFVQSLATRKIDAAIYPMTNGTATVYIVRTGRYATHEEAAAAAAAMGKQGLDAVIVAGE